MLDLVSIPTCESTQDLARQWLAQAPAQALLRQGGSRLFMTTHQTHGRGQHGRAWLPAGESLALSWALAEPPGVLSPGCWPVLAMAAVLRVLQSWLPSPLAAALTIKWPNDLLLGSRKVGGLLVERLPMALGSSGPAVLIIGLGLNGRHPPAHLASASQEGAHSALPAGGLLDDLAGHWQLVDMLPVLASALLDLLMRSRHEDQESALRPLWALAEEHLAWKGLPVIWTPALAGGAQPSALRGSVPLATWVPLGVDSSSGGLWARRLADLSGEPAASVPELILHGSLRRA